MLRRPRPGDTERDLLEAQRAFSAAGDAPSSRVTEHARVESESAPLVGEVVERSVEDARANARDSRSGRSTSAFARRARRSRRLASIPDRSAIVRGEAAAAIHAENVALLASMTEDDIAEARREALNAIGPDSLNFVRSLRREPTPVVDEPPSSPSPSSPPLPPVATDPRWLRFDEFEPDKLEWTTDARRPEPPARDEPYEARFDFDGNLLPYEIECDERSRTLFHHGAEPHRGGYSVAELLRLCRSTVAQQRAVALAALAGALERDAVGLYAGVVDLPLTEIFFVLRFAIDENAPSALESALTALRSALFVGLDEAHADAAFGLDARLAQPRLAPCAAVPDATEIGDFELATSDLLLACVRTGTLERLRYVLNTARPGFKASLCCVQILTAIARHSAEAALRIRDCDGLLDGVASNFLRPLVTLDEPQRNAERCVLTCTALKLLRIAVSQTEATLESPQLRRTVVDALSNYMGTFDVETVHQTRVRIEAFRLCSVLVSYGPSFEHSSDFGTNLAQCMKNCIDYVDLGTNCQKIYYSFAVSVLNLVNVVVKHARNCDADFMEIVATFVMQAVNKWCTQISVLNTFTSEQLNVVALSLTCFSSLQTCVAQFVFLTNVKHVNDRIMSIIDSKNFKALSKLLSKYSNLLCSAKVPKGTRQSNIVRLSSTIIDYPGKILPILKDLSCLPFISALAKYVSICNDDALKAKLLSNESMFEYLSAVVAKKKLNLLDNWFTRLEFDALYAIVFLSTSVLLNDAKKDIIYKLAFKLTYILPSDFRLELKYMLKNIIFNSDWFSAHRLFNILNISDMQIYFHNLQSLSQFYLSNLNLNVDNETNSLTIVDWNSAILPKDWTYMPILRLYAKTQNSTKRDDGNDLSKETISDIVIFCLMWIILQEKYFPDITNEISLTDRFCRLQCIFLCDNDVFLDKKVKPLIQKCVNIIFNSEKSFKFDFDKSLLGVNNFQDLYVQLVDQFQAVSYGDPIFAACILVPLAQRHNIKWRKLVWSEYAGCLRALDCPENMLCYSLQDYLMPPETDFSLLKCYHRALNTNLLRSGTIAYKIANHHVSLAIKRQNESR